MPTHPGHPAIASTTLVSASRSLLNDAFDSVSLQTVTATATLNPDDGRYVLVAPASHTTITLPDPASDERYQNVRLVLKRTTAGVYTATVVVAGGGLIDGSSSTTLNAQYDCEVLFSDGTAWHRLRDQTNLLAPDYLDFGDWIVGTDDSNPAPVATSDAYTAPDGTTTADELEWDNTTELADESWAEPGASVLEAGDGAEYSFYIDSEVGDGIKTVLEVEDTSVPGLLEQTTVAFSNVFAENRLIGTLYETRTGWETTDGGSPSTWSDATDPNGGTTAWTQTGAGSRLNCYIQSSFTGFTPTGHEATFDIWIYQTDFDQTITYQARAYGTSTTDYTSVSINSSGQIASFSAASTGPTYTQANSIRLTDEGGGWLRLRQRIADYSGTATTRFWWLIEGNSIKKTYWNPAFRYGDHVSSQQLLTVDDGVENLLNSAGVFDLSDFPTTVKMASVGASPIAAPDGTMTAIRCIGDLTGEATTLAVLNNSASPIDFTGQWSDAVAWTYSFYVYRPSIESGGTNYGKFQFSLVGPSGYNNYIQWRCTATSPLSSVVAVTPSTSSFTYSAERSIAVEEVGNSGWTKYTVTLVDTEQNITNIQLQMQHRGGDHYLDTWSPALRYGDWVARGKNRTNGIDPTLYSGFSGQTSGWSRSAIEAPDGTLSAYEMTWDGNATSYGGIAWDGSTDVPSDGIYSSEFYLYALDVDTADTSAGTYGTRFTFSVTAASTKQIIYGFNLNNDDFQVALLTGSPPPHQVTVERVGTSRWHRVSVWMEVTGSVTSADLTFREYRPHNPYGANLTMTVWRQAMFVGNPADARGYFVSGPQNLLGDGSDYTGGYWAKDASVTISANAQVAPNGRLEADDITRAIDADDFRVYPATIGSAITGGAVHYSFYVKPPSGLSSPSELISFVLADDPFTAFQEEVDVRLDYSVPAAPTVLSLSSITTGGPGYTVDDVTITPISNGWSRIQIDLFDYGNNAERVYIRHYGRSAANGGSAYTVSYWGSEVTTLDRTPTANELRPVSNGVVDFDAYPPEHRSLFADLEDAGDNWYKVTTKITDI